MKKLPLILFVFLAVSLAFFIHEGRNPEYQPSAMIGQIVPIFDLPSPVQGIPGFGSWSLQDEPTIVNVFASWCVACRAEQGVLMRAKKESGIKVYGLNYKDKPDAVAAWLSTYGNPYDGIGADVDGRVAIDWGVYGVPETFVVDARGIIRYRHVGDVTDELYRDVLAPLIQSLKMP